MATPKLFLWDHPMSSYAQKVRIVLREKNIPFDAQTPQGLGSGQPLPGLSAANPRIEVPALVDGDFSVFDSKVIIQYLEDKFPEPRLTPTDPRLRAEAGMIQEVCDGPFEAANWTFMEVNIFGRATGDLAARMNAATTLQIQKCLTWLNARLGEKQWFSGTGFGLADAYAFPVVNRSHVYGFSPVEGSPLDKWFARVKQRPFIQQTGSEMEAAVEAFKKVAASGVHPFQPGGGSKREYRDFRLEMMLKVGGSQVVLDGLRDDTIRFSWPDTAAL